MKILPSMFKVLLALGKYQRFSLVKTFLVFLRASFFVDPTDERSKKVARHSCFEVACGMLGDHLYRL